MSKLNALLELCKTAMVKSKPVVSKMVYYAKVELVPPKISELPALRNEIKTAINGVKSKRYLNVTVREAWLNTLVGIEVLCWFFIGECIGKRHIIGYKV